MSFAACGETNDMELATTRCIIAPLSPSRVFALVRFLRFSPALNQQIQLLLNRFALEDEGQQLHHILIGQDGRLFQKGLQHSGTSAKPMGSLASGQPFQLALQTLLLVLGCGQLRSATYCLCLSFSNSSLMGNFSFLIMGKTKATNFLRLIAFGLVIIKVFCYESVKALHPDFPVCLRHVLHCFYEHISCIYHILCQTPIIRNRN